MTSFADHVDDYLRLRRSFGFKLDEHERLLRKFATHMDDLGAEIVTIERALAWALERDLPAGSVVAATRLLVVRGFARYMTGLDPRTEIPPTQLIPTRRQRRTPFIYSSADIAALMEHARIGISYRLVAATHETLIGLLAVTGMRISEAIKLDRADIDWTDAILLVRESKFNKSRYLPLHPSTLDALERYAAVRDRLCPNPVGPSFFVSLRRGRLYDCAVQKTFRRVCQQAGVGATAPLPPRLHDLRHSLAVNTLLGWYREGADVHARLPVLSTYLGHLNPGYTYYYLSAAPELLAHAAGMRDAYWEGRS
ncbi:MAG: tyrosine-type recombinase/integrase [Actinobacteria bacterium]|nr:tyrosine-type recombinase/integrase [Actinomycetota bacterium]